LPQDYAGKTVVLEGKIIRECPTGCWFDLQQGQGQIHVDLNPNGFAIPQITGEIVMVEGQVKYEGQNVSVIGEGVKIK
jgi:uncharacterized protein YdeI (BOF family)